MIGREKYYHQCGDGRRNDPCTNLSHGEEAVSSTSTSCWNHTPDAVPFFSLRGRKCKPIFVQIARQVVKLNASDLRLPSRAWKVKLVGEGADDAGGVFDDTITEMCQVRAEFPAFPSAGPLTLWLRY